MPAALAAGFSHRGVHAERAGTKAGNKGWDAGVTAVEMVALERSLETAGF